MCDLKRFEGIRCIYMISSPDGKIYIGKTRNLMKRLQSWRSKDNCKGLLKDSILKHGWSNHEIKILHELPSDVDESIMYQYEKIYIDHYNSNKNKYPLGHGMNLTDGGKGCNGMRLSDSAKQKLRDLYFKESYKYLYTKGPQNPLYGVKGKDHPAYGFKHSEESKRRIGAANQLGKHNMARKIINLKTGKIFGCIKEAAATTTISYSALKAMLRGQNKNYSDFTYYNEAQC